MTSNFCPAAAARWRDGWMPAISCSWSRIKAASHRASSSASAAEAAFLKTVELLQLPVTEIAFCPHAAFPVSCFCRKPMPGLGVYLMQRYGLCANT